MKGLFVLWLNLVALGVASPARADYWADCNQTADLDGALRGCSNIIAAGRESSQNLAEAYYNRGTAYYRKGDHDRAIADYDKAIQLRPDYAEAYYNRGYAYDAKGDYDRATADYQAVVVLSENSPAGARAIKKLAARGDYATWAPLAAQGDASAQYKLGEAYEFGEGVTQDDTEAMKWYRKAGDRGNAQAEAKLGEIYGNGGLGDGASTTRDYVGVPKDYKEAVKWLRLAADQGNVNAQNNLGLMYKGGRGVPQDYILAYMWFNLAAAHRGLGAAFAAEDRETLAAEMTPDQIAEAQRLAREWKPTPKIVNREGLAQ